LGESGRVLSLLDGRKGRAYAAVFENGEPVGDAVDWAPNRAIELAGNTAFIAVGEGAQVWHDLLPDWAQIAETPTKSPVVEMLGYFDRNSEKAVAPEAVSLRYLRAPDAKLPKGAPQQGA
jgi:tRNA A37 threonylcarbamoyladenosine modification protein TsaB